MRGGFEERHRDNISRLKVILIVVCLIAIPVTFWVNHQDLGSVRERVSKVESPCLKYGSHSKPCEISFEAAVAAVNHREACAVERKAGTLGAIRELATILNVKFSEPCAGARLTQERTRRKERAASAAKGGGAFQQPSHSAHQPSGPSGSHIGNHGPGHSGHHAPLAPAPAPAPVAPAPAPSPGNSGDTPGAEHGAKACVEVAVSACVKAEAELPLHP